MELCPWSKNFFFEYRLFHVVEGGNFLWTEGWNIVHYNQFCFLLKIPVVVFWSRSTWYYIILEAVVALKHNQPPSCSSTYETVEYWTVWPVLAPVHDVSKMVPYFAIIAATLFRVQISDERKNNRMKLNLWFLHVMPQTWHIIITRWRTEIKGKLNAWALCGPTHQTSFKFLVVQKQALICSLSPCQPAVS
jgi:hypothetical protein